MQPSEPETALPNFASLRRSILISLVLPAVATALMTRAGTPLSQATLVSTVFPLVELFITWRATRKLDAIAVLSLVLLGAGLATSSASGNGRLMYAKDSALTLASGLVFLGSLLLQRPLMYHVARSYMVGVSAEAWDTRWRLVPQFRRTMRTLTAVWGAGLVMDALCRLAFVRATSPAMLAIVSPAIAVVTFAALIVWTRAYVRAVRARAAASASV